MIRNFAAAVVLVLSVTTAHAGPSVPVSFADLNLSNPDDIQVLAVRIHVAAETACGPSILLPGASGFIYREQHQTCVDRTSHKAIEQAEAMAGRSSYVARK